VVRDVTQHTWNGMGMGTTLELLVIVLEVWDIYYTNMYIFYSTVQHKDSHCKY
jgi:hypothetical protein